MVLEPETVVLLRFFLFSLSSDIFIEGHSSLFGHCLVTFSYLELPSFFSGLVQKVVKFCF